MSTEILSVASPSPFLEQTTEPPQELIFSASQKITFQCGLSSITLHANGKIVLRGEEIWSIAMGTNRITGGVVELN